MQSITTAPKEKLTLPELDRELSVIEAEIVLVVREREVLRQRHAGLAAQQAGVIQEIERRYLRGEGGDDD